MAVSDGASITVVKDRASCPTSSTSGPCLAARAPRHRPHPLLHHRARRTWRNAQPVYRERRRDRQFALGHNGNLTNTAALAAEAGMLPGTVGVRQRPRRRAARRRARDASATSAATAATSSGPCCGVLPRLDGAFSLRARRRGPRHRRARPQRLPAAVPRPARARAGCWRRRRRRSTSSAPTSSASSTPARCS